MQVCPEEERIWGCQLPIARWQQEWAPTLVLPILTWYLWNSDLFTAAAITPVTERLYLYDVVLIKGQGELNGGFISFYYRRAALPVPPVQNLQQRGEREWRQKQQRCSLPQGCPDLLLPFSCLWCSDIQSGHKGAHLDTAPKVFAGDPHQHWCDGAPVGRWLWEEGDADEEHQTLHWCLVEPLGEIFSFIKLK